MNFKKIELGGFKSFADKLEIKFDSGITGIVGPNGCGKSNVSDAIRWVLGEQSTKLLRSSNMQEVIFNGTEKRKSMSYCEVSLFFDNTTRMFDLNYDEVAFTRKLYRSGESEYLINGTPCRMKDIVSALHDSGIGKEGYSIIGQGKVEEIISAKPENRRAIFEEAAGIAKFKQRKIEAQRKLERTQENLNRAQDVLTEQEKQLGPLKKQSENAKRFLELKDDLKVQEVNVYVNQFDNNSQIKMTIQTKIDGLDEELNMKQTDLDKVSAQYESKMQEVSKIDRTLQDLNDQILSLTVDLEKRAGETNVLRERLKFLSDERDNLKQDYEKEILNKNNAIILIENCEKAREDKERKYKEVCYKLKDLTEKYLKIVDELTGAEDEATKKQKEMIAELSKLTDVKSNLSALTAQRDAYQNNIADLDSKIKVLKGKIADKEESLQVATSTARSAEETLEHARRDSEKLQQKIAETQARVKENSAKINQSASSIEILKNRKKVLEDMQKDFDGFNYTVKRLMQDAKSQIALQKRIVGLVASCMSIPAGYETAIEVALGGAVQNVITHSEEDADYLISYLKQNNLGRATFLPISSMKVKYLSPEEMSAVRRNRASGVASEIVKFDPSLRVIFDSLLARTVIVESIDRAIALAKQTNFSFKIVTLDGEVFSTQGSISGGSKKAITSNLLMRDNEIENLGTQITKLNNSLVEFKSVEQQLENTLAMLIQDNDALSAKVMKAQVDMAKQAQNLEQLTAYVEDLDKERIALSQEKINYTAKIEIISKALTDKNLNSLSDGESDAKMQNSIKIFNNLRTQRDALQEQLTEVKIEKTTLEGEIANLDSEFKRLDESIKTLNFSILEIKQNVEKVEDNLTAAKEIVSAKLDEVDDGGIREKIAQAKTKLSTLDETKQAVQGKIKSLDDEKSRLMAEINIVSEKKYQQTSALSKVDTDIETMQEKIYEDYELVYSSCLPLRVENFDVKQGMIEVNRLKKEISKLGYINVNAIEDCKELMERYQTLSAQAEDLITAKEDLTKIIKDLSAEMLTRFNTEFAKIQVNFSKSFRELFGGGNAKLQLTESEDPLEAGVEIIAEPPGKKLQSITLLSGGEKALTAIAILFAILRLRPMPFCLLDEIEAALDDTNVTRFAQYLKNFSRDTQFIVITHRKPTMMLADALYGVTMEEPGVSKIVSVHLQDAIKSSEEEQKKKKENIA